jgi:hypothetical protein
MEPEFEKGSLYVIEKRVGSTYHELLFSKKGDLSILVLIK